jgi:isopenicillin N synthase-like dioxygenase
MYYEQLRDNLYATVPYPAELTALMQQATTWRDFCALPSEVKHQFAFPDDQGKKDPGYKERTKTAGRDDKWFYHYMPDNDILLERYYLRPLVAQEPVLQRFFEFAATTHQLIFQLVMDIGRDLEPSVPGIVEQLDRGRNHFTYRYLYYTPPTADDVILAAPHFDRAGFTLHLYESCPGLQLLTRTGQWVDAPIGAGQTVIFTGYRLEVATHGDLQKTWHRVVRHGPAGPEEKRTSILLFVPLVDIPAYPEATRSQDLQPGYAPRR